MQDVQNREAQKDKLLPAVAKRSIADFGNGMDHLTWKVTRVGAEETAISKVFDQGQNKATTSVNKHGNLRFKGTWAFPFVCMTVDIYLS